MRLDGEIIALGPDGPPSFGALQSRMAVNDERQGAKARETLLRPHSCAFDVLVHDGRRRDGAAVRGAPGPARGAADRRPPVTVRAGVRSRLTSSAIAREQRPGGRRREAEGAALRARAAVGELDQEALPATSGRRHRWLGAGPARPGRAARGTAGRGARRTAPCVYAGQVGTGFTARTLADLQSRLAPLHTEHPPFADLTALRRRATTSKPTGCARNWWLWWSSGNGPRRDGCAPRRSRGCAPTSHRRRSFVTPSKPARCPVDVEGRRLVLSNLDKVLYPDAGFTKGQVHRLLHADRPVPAAPPRRPAADPQALSQRGRRRVLLREERPARAARSGSAPPGCPRPGSTKDRDDIDFVDRRRAGDPGLRRQPGVAGAAHPDVEGRPEGRRQAAGHARDRPRPGPPGHHRRVLPGGRTGARAESDREWYRQDQRLERACSSTPRPAAGVG